MKCGAQLRRAQDLAAFARKRGSRSKAEGCRAYYVNAENVVGLAREDAHAGWCDTAETYLAVAWQHLLRGRGCDRVVERGPPLGAVDRRRRPLYSRARR